jgi:hypothetical protein
LKQTTIAETLGIALPLLDCPGIGTTIGTGPYKINPAPAQPSRLSSEI